MARKAKSQAGRVSMQDLMSLVNKKAGSNVAPDLTGDNPTEVQEWIPLIKVYFQAQDEALALTVMYCESRGYANATGYNTDGSYDQGLFQFNNRTEKWLEDDIYNKDLDMYDAETNVKAARWLSFYDGWHHWNSSKHCWGRYDT